MPSGALIFEAVLIFASRLGAITLPSDPMGCTERSAGVWTARRAVRLRSISRLGLRQFRPKTEPGFALLVSDRRAAVTISLF
jgi:hypothetical protein